MHVFTTILIGFLVVVHQLAYSSPTLNQYSSLGIKEVDLESLAGQIRVLGIDSQTIEIHATPKNFPSSACQFIHAKEDDKIKVKVKKLNTYDSCELDLILKIPKQLQLDIDHGGGNIDAENLHNKMEITLGSGNLTMSGEYVKLEAKIGSGGFNGKGLSSDTELKVGAGNIEAVFQRHINSGKAKFKTGAGNLAIHLSREQKFTLEGKVGMGHKSIDMQPDPQANFKIEASVGVGNLSVRPAGGF